MRKEEAHMMIRPAEDKDIPRIMELLHQVLEVHASIRPDLFISGTSKYTEQELLAILHNENTPVFAAADENDRLIGYAFCVLQEPEESNNMIPYRTVYIDDLCVDETCRGQQIGQKLYAYVRSYAKQKGCGYVTLHVWQGNDSALRFYEKAGLQPRKIMMEEKL